MARYDALDAIRADTLRPSSRGEGAPGARARSRPPSSGWRARSCAATSSRASPRIDGRDTKTVRPITIRTGVLPRTHGSALFTRGETQALVITTLGTERDSQIIDALDGERREPFMLHYNFPPFCVGEIGRVGSPKRREIGHGRLAKRGVLAVHARHRGVPLLGARGLRDHRVQRLQLHGQRLRHQPVADGRRRADQGRRWPAWPWA